MNNLDTIEYINKKIKEDPEFQLEYYVEERKIQLAEMLSRYRKEKKISQEKLSNKSGLTRQMISKVETYTSTPTLTTFVKYLYGLDIDLNKILIEYLFEKK